MKISFLPKLKRCDVLILPVFQHKKLPSQALRSLSRISKVILAEALNDSSFKAELGQVLSVHTAKDLAHKIILLGLGEEKDYSPETLRRACGKIAKNLKKAKVVALDLPRPDIQEALEGLLLGMYEFRKYLPVENYAVTELAFFGSKKVSADKLSEIQKTCEAVKYVRDLVNDPDHSITPNYLANEALHLAKDFKDIRVTDLNMSQLEKLGMGALVAVGRGSIHAPHLVLIEYKPTKARNKKPLALVGKGITFDTGGLNLKPQGHIETMKQDMAGAATVLATLKLAASLKWPIHLVAALPLAENAISDKATKPGSIVKAYNGKTIEITNTDAEGRLILADALAYTIEKYKPSHIVDLATLTGAVIVALGHDITGVMSNNSEMAKKYLSTTKLTAEKAWELPLDRDYSEAIKGKISDLLNHTRSLNAGTIAGALFLEYFIDKTPWLHLDIAGTAWCDKGKHYKSAGGTGEPLRTLCEFLKNLV